MTLTAPPQTPVGGVTPAPVPPARKRRLAGTSPATRTLISTVDLQRHRGLYFTVLGLTIAVFVLVFLLPLYWMFASAVKSPAEYALNTPTFIPHSWHPENYPNAWDNMGSPSTSPTRCCIWTGTGAASPGRCCRSRSTATAAT